jgi:hypothetical protein
LPVMICAGTFWLHSNKIGSLARLDGDLNMGGGRGSSAMNSITNQLRLDLFPRILWWDNSRLEIRTSSLRQIMKPCAFYATSDQAT